MTERPSGGATPCPARGPSRLPVSEIAQVEPPPRRDVPSLEMTSGTAPLRFRFLSLSDRVLGQRSRATFSGRVVELCSRAVFSSCVLEGATPERLAVPRDCSPGWARKRLPGSNGHLDERREPLDLSLLCLPFLSSYTGRVFRLVLSRVRSGGCRLLRRRTPGRRRCRRRGLRLLTTPSVAGLATKSVAAPPSRLGPKCRSSGTAPPTGESRPSHAAWDAGEPAGQAGELSDR